MNQRHHVKKSIYLPLFVYLRTKPKPEALNKLNWSITEEYIFFESHKILGNKWSSITKFLPDRSDNNLKNHFYSNLRKTLRRFIKEKFNYSND
jgi:Myb-like DNA-binding domain